MCYINSVKRLKHISNSSLSWTFFYMEVLNERAFIQSWFILFFYCSAVTQFLGGLWKGIFCKEKGSRCLQVQRRTAWGFLSRGSFDWDALPQTVSCLFPLMKQETSDIPLNVDDSPLCALAYERWQGWGVLLYIKGSWVASLTTHGLT